ncbi:MAG: 23S rRNA (uracil(1939)-C(5))-methyltransferase RlmD [Clostridium sp.]
MEKKKLQFKKNDEIVITIEDLGKDGEGIGHVDGYALFVKGALPGEKVLVHLMKLNKNYGFARLVEILEPSKERMTPSCPSASLCGGCTLQHFSYKGQLAFKEKKVKDCLERLGGVDLSSVTWLPILGMTGENESPWHYRNKAQFPVREDENGIPQTGFFAGRSHRLIPASSCAIQHPVINEVVETVMDFLRAYGISAYREESHKGLVRHIYVRRGYHTGQIMVCLVINGNELPHAAEFITRLRTIEGMTSICLNFNTKKTNVILGSSTKLLWGSPAIEDKIGGIRYQISPQSFYQVNPVQTEKLYQTALDFADLQGDERVWDLYCGIGTISLFLAKAVPNGQVTGVEIVPEAIENAKKNAALNGISNTSFYCGAAEDVVTDMVAKRRTPSKEDTNGALADVVVVDPPRKGCDAKLLDTIVTMNPEKIVYVSCDPATLARDVKALGEKGYEVKKVRACDMFPQGGACGECGLFTEGKGVKDMAHIFEYQVEKLFINRLQELGYDFVELNNYADVISNFRLQLAKFNARKLEEKGHAASFSDAEFNRIMIHVDNHSVYESAKILRDEYVLQLDNGESVYIDFFSGDTDRNIYQVTHQVTMDKAHRDDVVYKNRYDVTVLINGLPIVQIELKRPGVEINEAINQINRYRKFSFKGIFRYLQLFVVSNSVQTKYFCNENEMMDGQYNPILKSLVFFWTDEKNTRINDLNTFTGEFFRKSAITEMMDKYMVIKTTEPVLMVMRPYQIYAVKAAKKRVLEVNQDGYVFACTGSGKTLTSFKLAQLLRDESMVDLVVFLIDRKDLDDQTVDEYNSFEKDCVDNTNSTAVLINMLKSSEKKDDCYNDSEDGKCRQESEICRCNGCIHG